MLAVLGTIVPSSLIPVCLVVASQYSGFYFGRLVPSLLAAVSTMAASLTLIVRPFEQWQLFRKYQRTLEFEKFRFENGAEPYGGADAMTVFLNRIDQLTLGMQGEWAGVMPTASDLASAARGS